MFSSKFTMALVATSLAFTMPATKVAADAGDAIVGGIIGGVIGGAIANSQPKKKVYKKTYTKKPAVSSATRAQNREIQTSLNYFGFPAGTPDGVLGRNSRAAISNYQVFMGYPATGQLTTYERDFLVTSYHRAIAGGPATTQMIAANPQGSRGLLKTYQQQAAGVPTTTMVVTPQAPAMAPATTVVVAPQPAPTLAPTPAPTTPVATTPAMPNFMGQTAPLSLASHCNTVSLLTNTNGGFTTAAAMTNANDVLNEQFCLARTYAIARGEEMASKVQGATTAQIQQQCEAFAPALKEHVAALSLKPQADVMQGVGAFALSSGMSPAQLVGTAKICLSVGYRTDNMDVALGSALLLVALGEQPYAELMGHHLSQGFGTSKRADLALPWYETATTAISAGATPVFAPGQPERAGLIIKAAQRINGQDGAAVMTPQPTAPQPAALPSFSLQD